MLHRAAVAVIAVFVGAACLAPAASAWHGDLQVRKVNVGGPSTDVFNFKVEARRYGQQAWTLLPQSDYAGAAWMAKGKPDNPFALFGAPGPAGPFVHTGSAPTEALFTGIDSAGEVAVAAHAVRNWRGVRVTETSSPAGYRTSAACSIANNASGVAWSSSLDSSWGAWTATSTAAGGGPGVETTLRWLPDTASTYSRIARARRARAATQRWSSNPAPSSSVKGPWTVKCTFTNTYRARVKVLKRFQSPVTTAPLVDITVNGTDVDTAAGAESFGDGDASDWVPVDGGSDVALAESAGPGTVLTDYTATLECRSGTGGAFGDWALVASGTSGTLKSTVPGRDYECRFTNVGRTPGGGTQPGGPTTGGGTPGSGVGTPTGTTGGPVTPSGTPTGRTASARVVGTTGCVVSSHAIADVRGRQIAKVTFRVNGRVVRTLTNANVAGMFRLRVRTASLPRGASRVTADVTFKVAANTAPRRLSLVLSRCPRRTVPPPFTG